LRRVANGAPAKDSNLAIALGIALGVIVPVAGVVIAIMLFANGRARPATWVAAATVLGAALYAALLL
jgi:uncharacterized membrane protein